MSTLLTLAGRRRVGSSWDGGAVVQLGTDGTWRELAAADSTVFWRLKNFVNGAVHTLFHIRSGGFAPLNTPYRGELYRSIDQGVSWTKITPQTGAPEEFARDIAQDANGDLWCITDERERPNDVLGNSQPSRIYKSTDNGVTWTLKYTTVNSFVNRFYQLYNITCHPTDANIIVAEGVEMLALNTRLWKTTDGRDNWTRFTPTYHTTPPDQVQNVSGVKQHVFDYTKAGDLVYAGIMETDSAQMFIMKSLDDGDSFEVYYTQDQVADYGAMFYESTQVYILHNDNMFESAAPVGQSQLVKIGDDDDPPFTTAHSFHGVSRYAIHSVDTLHLGCHVISPSGTVTLSPSVFTRPADLSSDWIEHPNFANMDSDLGYRLYVAIDGLVGATAFEGEVPVPPKFDEPPAGDPGAGAPDVGEARIPRREPVVRRGLRGRRGFKAGPPGHRGLPPVQGEQIDKKIPDEYEEPLVRKWLTFGWLAVPMLEGQKTITLRDWGPTEGVQWQHGELFYAYDTPPVEGGRRLAILRVMQEPFVEFTARLRMSDYHKLGYSYAMANRLMAPSGRTALQVWEDLHNNPESLWLLRFAVERIFEQGRKERDTVQIAERPPQ